MAFNAWSLAAPLLNTIAGVINQKKGREVDWGKIVASSALSIARGAMSGKNIPKDNASTQTQSNGQQAVGANMSHLAPPAIKPSDAKQALKVIQAGHPSGQTGQEPMSNRQWDNQKALETMKMRQGKGTPSNQAFKTPYPQTPVKTYTDGGKKQIMPKAGQKWVSNEREVRYL